MHLNDEGSLASRNSPPCALPRSPPLHHHAEEVAGIPYHAMRTEEELDLR